jgi:WD40 repeat protein
MTGDMAITAVKIWDVSTTGGAEWVNVPAAPGSPIGFTPRGDLVGESPDGHSAWVQDSDDGEQLALIPATATTLGFDLSEDGQLLATSSPTGTVEVWDVASGERQLTTPIARAGDSYADATSWSSDGAFLAVLTGNDAHGDVVILNRSGHLVGALREKAGKSIWTASFSPDGRLLATTTLGTRIDPNGTNTQIWDWQNHRVVTTIPTYADLATFDPSGTRLATAFSFEGKADIWDARTGERLATLATPAPVSAIAFSPDGETIATGNYDGTITLWDTRSGIQKQLLHASPAAVQQVAFSPDGTKLASNGPDGIVRVWAVNLDDLLAIAHERLTRTHRTMTDAECRQYLHAESCPDT